VLVFSRNVKDGQITQLAGTAGCISEDGSGGECTDGKALIVPQGVGLDRSNKNVYVASNGSGAVAAFSRDSATGALTQLAGTAGCVSEDGTGGECAVGSALANAHRVVVAPNNKWVHVTSDAGVATFSRSKSTGILTQPVGTAGCITETGSGGACDVGTALDGAWGIAATSSKKHFYVAASNSDSVVALKRQ
jgi:DNA-binding beta-propeller fold protein YncE